MSTFMPFSVSPVHTISACHEAPAKCDCCHTRMEEELLVLDLIVLANAVLECAQYGEPKHVWTCPTCREVFATTMAFAADEPTLCMGCFYANQKECDDWDWADEMPCLHGHDADCDCGIDAAERKAEERGEGCGCWEPACPDCFPPF